MDMEDKDEFLAMVMLSIKVVVIVGMEVVVVGIKKNDEFLVMVVEKGR